MVKKTGIYVVKIYQGEQLISTGEGISKKDADRAVNVLNAGFERALIPCTAYAAEIVEIV